MTQQQTVGEIAANSLAAVRVFESHGIDYCCGGQKPLDQACREKGLDAEKVLSEVLRANGQSQDRNWTAASLGDLISHIVDTHHAYLTREFPVLTDRMAKVRKAHGEQFPWLALLAQQLQALREELEAHTLKEERILFPFIERAESVGMQFAAPPLGTFAHPIAVMEHEHDSAGRALAEMRRLTDGYQLPQGACNTFRALYEGLEELEGDLHMHIHLENNVLFPRALDLR